MSNNITINIGSLVKEIKITTATEGESEKRVRASVTKTLLNAVRDAETIIDDKAERVKVLLNSLEDFGFESYRSQSSGLLLEDCKEFIELKALILK